MIRHLDGSSFFIETLKAHLGKELPVFCQGGGELKVAVICREKESTETEDGVAEVDDTVAMGDEDHRVVRKL